VAKKKKRRKKKPAKMGPKSPNYGVDQQFLLRMSSANYRWVAKEAAHYNQSMTYIINEMIASKRLDRRYSPTFKESAVVRRAREAIERAEAKHLARIERAATSR
jgi:hypothetical protein